MKVTAMKTKGRLFHFHRHRIYNTGRKACGWAGKENAENFSTSIVPVESGGPVSR